MLNINKLYGLLEDGIINETQYSVETRVTLIEYKIEEIGVLYKIVREHEVLPVLRRLPIRFPSLD